VARIVDKVSLDRLRDRELRVSFLCPYCRSVRITLAATQTTDDWNGIDCPKCEAHILLDSVSLVVIKEGGSRAGG
jgi:transcription elongation factor Elf1